MTSFLFIFSPSLHASHGRKGLCSRPSSMCASSAQQASTSMKDASETLYVRAASKEYPIHFRRGQIAHASSYEPYVRGDKALIVTNDTVGPLYLERVQSALQTAGKTVFTHVLPDGEQYKSVECLSHIWDTCMEARLDRRSTLIALGGGVVGDITGFAAASFVRGVPFIQVPTTLLAVVDSAVGGKTAVNHARGKNMIGAFYQPEAVLVDVDVLETLDDRQLAAGLAEVIKYGIIRDWQFFEWCEENIEKLVRRDEYALRYAMRKSCEYKADIVREDETESGVRAILNLGHTFGHAIEASLGYGAWLHGEAVAAGMVMACEMSERMGFIGKDITTRVETVLSKASLPIRPHPRVTLEHFMTYMAVDKKVESGKLRLVLLKEPGHAFVTANFEQETLFDTIMHFHKMYKAHPGSYETHFPGLTV